MQIELVPYLDHMTHHMYCPNCHRLFMAQEVGCCYCSACATRLDWDNNDKMKYLHNKWEEENKSLQELYTLEKRMQDESRIDIKTK